MDAVYEVFRVSSILLENSHLESFDIDHLYTVLRRPNSDAFQTVYFLDGFIRGMLDNS